MGTYDYEKIVSDCANNRITAEMAVGHAWQYIGKLYEIQPAQSDALYWRNRENPLGFSHEMKGQYFLPLCAQTGFSKWKCFYSARDLLSWLKPKMFTLGFLTIGEN